METLSRWFLTSGGGRRFISSSASSSFLTAGGTGKTTLNETEVNKFRPLNSDWWDPLGPMKALHSMNDLRASLIRDGLTATQRTGGTCAAEPLSGTSILDVGCGGGILTERLARMGAQVVGVDAAEENVRAAKTHLSKDPLLQDRINYFAGTVEDFASSRRGDDKFDAVVASEVIEHVSNPSTFVAECSSLIDDDGGSFFLTTVNRTHLSYAAAILAAEYVLRLLPVGTHDWNNFVGPETVGKWLRDAGCTKIRLVHGMFYHPFVNRWSWVSDTSVNYAIHAVKQQP